MEDLEVELQTHQSRRAGSQQRRGGAAPRQLHARQGLMVSFLPRWEGLGGGGVRVRKLACKHVDGGTPSLIRRPFPSLALARVQGRGGGHRLPDRLCPLPPRIPGGDVSRIRHEVR